MREVARLHLRSTVPGVNHTAIERWCIPEDGNGWAGMGWGVWDSPLDNPDWQGYADAKAAEGESVNDSVRRLHDLHDGALIWTRRSDSTYWLGELTGGWRYQDSPSMRQIDMFNVRPCRWWKVGEEDAVPGVIVGNFRARKTLNPVANRIGRMYTNRRFAQLSGVGDADDRVSATELIEGLLGAADLEDLVAAYLQDQFNYVLVSRRPSTAGYEYVLRGRTSGRKAVVSVKSGGDAVDVDAMPFTDHLDLWAFAVCAPRQGSAREDVRWISVRELAQFVETRPEVQPDQVRYWLHNG